MTDAVQLAKSVLAADGQPFTTLSLAQGLPPVTADTPIAEARRNYMRLAGTIHPDRLQGSFDRATEAFQSLVRAFECFADPKARKKAAVAVAKKEKAASTAAGKGKKTRSAAAPVPSVSPKSSQPPTADKSPAASKKSSKKGEKASATPPKKAAKKKRATESDEEESEESEAEESESEASAADEEAWEEWAAADAEPAVSTSRTPIGQPRVGGLYQQTTIGCPKCRSLWEPDSKPQYSLFMGPWGKKVHCQLCLFGFGCATALHNCPHCSSPFDYDVSMYDVAQTCKKCKQDFGFPYYPVNQHLIDQIALEAWKEQKERQKASEREARARARRDDGSDEAEKTQLLIGTCIMEEECPLCHQRVKSKHRSHVLECLAKSPEERTASASRKQPTKRAADTAETVAAKKAPVAVKAAKTAPKPPAKTTAKKASKSAPVPARGKARAPAKGKRRRAGSSSDEDESSMSESVSEDDEDETSESSFSDDDEDSD